MKQYFFSENIIPRQRSKESLVGESFRLNTPQGRDVIDELSGERRLYWERQENDEQIAPLANWSSLYQMSEGNEYLLIPHGTRNAASILAGVEAWDSEKSSILQDILSYLDAVKQMKGRIDIGVTLDSVGVTRSERPMVFITPPHSLTNDSEEILSWAQKINQDVTEILHDSQKYEELIEGFKSAIELISTNDFQDRETV